MGLPSSQLVGVFLNAIAVAKHINRAEMEAVTFELSN